MYEFTPLRVVCDFVPLHAAVKQVRTFVDPRRGWAGDELVLTRMYDGLSVGLAAPARGGMAVLVPFVEAGVGLMEQAAREERTPAVVSSYEMFAPTVAVVGADLL